MTEAELHKELAKCHRDIAYHHEMAAAMLERGDIPGFRAYEASIKAYHLSAMAYESELRDL